MMRAPAGPAVRLCRRSAARGELLHRWPVKSTSSTLRRGTMGAGSFAPAVGALHGVATDEEQEGEEREEESGHGERR